MPISDNCRYCVYHNGCLQSHFSDYCVTYEPSYITCTTKYGEYKLTNEHIDKIWNEVVYGIKKGNDIHVDPNMQKRLINNTFNLY